MSTIGSMSPRLPGRRRILIWFASFFVAIAALFASLYLLFVPGLSSARNEPPVTDPDTGPNPIATANPVPAAYRSADPLVGVKS